MMGGTPLTENQVALVKATVPILQSHGETITTIFYSNMLAAHSELKNVFSAVGMATGKQPRALAGAVLAYAAHVDNPSVLLSAVERIAHKHVSLGITPDQYPLVGKYLLEAIVQVLGPEVATEDIVSAWAAAYGVLADIFITMEKGMCSSNTSRPNGWTGFRKFRVTRRVAESSTVTSLYLVPADGATPLPSYKPGQFVSVRVLIAELGVHQARQYSLSEAPQKEGSYYRISVKRDDDGASAGLAGVVSGALHGALGAVGAEVEVSHPQGDFFVDPTDASKDGAPVVLISAGVGATPMMAMLGALARPIDEKMHASRPVSWVHASRSSAEMPFGEAVRSIAKENEKVSVKFFLKNVTDGAGRAADCDFAGTRMELGRLDKEKDLCVADRRAEYYICGPEPFMVDMRNGLVNMGVDSERIHLELFASGGVAES